MLENLFPTVGKFGILNEQNGGERNGRAEQDERKLNGGEFQNQRMIGLMDSARVAEELVNCFLLFPPTEMGEICILRIVSGEGDESTVGILGGSVFQPLEKVVAVPAGLRLKK